VRVHADRRPHARIGLRERDRARVVRHAVARADRDQAQDAARERALGDRGAVFAELVRAEMAVAVEPHQRSERAPAAWSASRARSAVICGFALRCTSACRHCESTRAASSSPAHRAAEPDALADPPPQPRGGERDQVLDLRRRGSALAANSSAQSSTAGSACPVARRSAPPRRPSRARRADRGARVSSTTFWQRERTVASSPAGLAGDEHERRARRRLLEQAQQRVLRLLIEPFGVAITAMRRPPSPPERRSACWSARICPIRTRVSSAPRSTQNRSEWSPMCRNSGPLWPVPSIAISSRVVERRQPAHSPHTTPRSQTLARAKAWAAPRAGLARTRDQVGRMEPPARESAFEEHRKRCGFHRGGSVVERARRPTRSEV
jgi:hypothetical protein